MMSGDDRILSAYGCSNKWSVIEGKSQEGNKMYAWLNTEYKKAIRYSYGEARSLEYIKKMRSFFTNNLDWVKGKDTPSADEGIHGVWNDKFAELIWTIRGRRKVPALIPFLPLGIGGRGGVVGIGGGVHTLYVPGAAGSYGGEIYEAAQGATDTNIAKSPYWVLIAHGNPKYYN